MSHPERRRQRPTGPIDYILVGFVIAAIGGVFAVGSGALGWFIASAGVIVTTVGTIGMGVRVGLEDAGHRRSQREAAA